jgi:hypothetical protein
MKDTHLLIVDLPLLVQFKKSESQCIEIAAGDVLALPALGHNVDPDWSVISLHL